MRLRAWLLFLSILLLIGLSATVLAADYAVEIIPPPAKAAQPGEFVTQVFTVINQGTNDDTYDLEAAVPQGWALLDLPGEISLAAGESARVFISVLIPTTAPAGPYELRLRACSQADPTVCAEAIGLIEVIAAVAIRVIPPSGVEAEPGELVNYIFTVKNEGNVPDIFSLEASSSRGYQVEVEPQLLPLPCGQQAPVRVSLAIPVEAPPGLDRLTLRATSTTYSQAFAEGTVLTRILPPGPEAVGGSLFLTLPSELRLEGSLGRLRTSFRTGGTIPKLFGFTLQVSDIIPAQSPSFSLTFRSEPPNLTASISKSPEAFSFNFFYGGMGGISFLEVFKDEAHKLSGSLSLSHGYPGFGMSAIGEVSSQAGAVDYAAHLDLFWRAEALKLAGRLFRIGPEFYGGGKDNAGFLGSLGFSGLGLSLLANYEFSHDNVAKTLPKTVTKTVTRLAGGFASTGLGLPSPRLAYELATRASDDWPPTVRTRDKKRSFSLFAPLESASISLSYADERLFDGGQRDDDGDGHYDEDWVDGLDNDGDGRTDEDGPNLDAFDISALGLNLRLGRRPSFGHLSLAWEMARIAADNDDDGLENEDPIDGVDNDGDCLGDTNDDGLVCSSGDIGVDEDGPLGPGFDDGRIRDRSLRLGLGVSYHSEFLRGALDFWTGDERTGLSFELVARLGSDAEAWFSSAITVDSLTGEQGLTLGLGVAARFDLPTAWPVKGRIEGRLFVDADEDNHYDPGEEGIAGVIIVADGTSVRSGKEGLFRFPPLWSGWYELRIEDLPAGLAPLVKLPIWVDLAAGEVKKVDLPLRRVGAIEGLVFEDANRDGMREEGERGLSGIRISLAGPSGSQTTISNPQGRFSFTDLGPGKYLVRLDTTTLPQRYEPTTPVEVQLSLRPGERLWLEFGAAEKERQLVIAYNPVAVFAFTPESPRVGEKVTFDGSGSYDPDGYIVRYEWDFDGDGITDAEGKIVEHGFTQAGTYPVKLTVTDNDGFKGSLIREVRVQPEL
ncbi:MAG: PKD domain-containing protein [Candidatus Bipolaricaulia bacterium]